MIEKTSISMDGVLLKRLRKLAKDQDTSVSSLIEGFVRQGIDAAELAVEVRNDPITERLIAEMLRPENIERAARIVGESADNPSLFKQRAEALAKRAQTAKGKS